MKLRSSLTGILLLTFAVGAMPAEAGDRAHSKHFHKQEQPAPPPPAPEPPAPVEVVQPPPPPPPPAPPPPEEDTFYVGLEGYYIEPRFSGNPAFLVHNDDGATDFHQQTDFEFDGSFAPRLTIGSQAKDDIGWRVSAFTYNDSSDVASAVDATGAGAGTANQIFQTAAPAGLGFYSTGTAAAPTALRFRSSLGIDTAEFELTYAERRGRLSMDYSGGLQWADLKQVMFGSERAVATGATLSTLNSQLDYQGIGPTASVKGAVQLSEGSDLALYGKGRGSLLFGDGEQTVTLGVTPIGNTVRGRFTNHTATDDIIPMGEMEAGIEWKSDWNDTRVAFSLGAFGQAFLGAGNATGAETLAPRADAGGTTTVFTTAGAGAQATLTGASTAATNGVPTRQFDADQADNDANLGLIGVKAAFNIWF